MSGNAIVAHLKVSGSQISLDQIQGLLPALGIQLPAGSVLRGGTLTANVSLDGPIDRLVATGSAEVSNSQLAGFDLGSKLASLPGLGGREIQIFRL